MSQPEYEEGQVVSYISGPCCHIGEIKEVLPDMNGTNCYRIECRKNNGLIKHCVKEEMIVGEVKANG